MAAHVDDVNDHEQERCITALLGEPAHSRKQFGDTLLDGCRTGRLNSPDGKPGIADSELFEIGGEQVFGRTFAQVSGGLSKNGLTKLLDIFACDSGQFGSNVLVSQSAGGRTEDQGIIKQTCQQESSHLTWNSYTRFMIESSDNGACTANRVGPEHDGPVSMDVGNAMMVDNAQQFGLFDALDGL